MRIVWILMLMLATVHASPTRNLYFEFDEKAVMVGGEFEFCKAVLDVLKPDIDHTEECQSGTLHFQTFEKNGRLAHCKIMIPVEKTADISSETARSQLSTALQQNQFFLTPATVTFVVDFEKNIGLSIGVTVGVFTLCMIVSLYKFATC